MVIRGNDVHEEDVFRFGVKARHLHFVTGKHPPRGDKGGDPESQRQRQREKEKINANVLKSASPHFNGRSYSLRSAQERSDPRSAPAKIHSGFPCEFWGGERPRGELEAGDYL